jgi:renal tumor antigen
MVAIKCMKTNYSSQEQVDNLKEIQALKRISNHPHIITMLEYI